MLPAFEGRASAIPRDDPLVALLKHLALAPDRDRLERPPAAVHVEAEMVVEIHRLHNLLPITQHRMGRIALRHPPRHRFGPKVLVQADAIIAAFGQETVDQVSAAHRAHSFRSAFDRTQRQPLQEITLQERVDKHDRQSDQNDEGRDQPFWR